MTSGVVANIYLSERLPFASLPLEVGSLFEARGSGGALKLPQRVRAELGHQTHFAALLFIPLNENVLTAAVESWCAAAIHKLRSIQDCFDTCSSFGLAARSEKHDIIQARNCCSLTNHWRLETCKRPTAETPNLTECKRNSSRSIGYAAGNNANNTRL